MVVSAKNLIKKYVLGDNEVRALDDVSVDIAQGEFVCILGSSGSGKSTFMNIIAGFDKPTEGEVTVGGENIFLYNDKKLSEYRNKQIGFVFQSFNLDPSLTALENVMLPLVYAGTKRHRRRQLAEQALARVSLLDRGAHRPSQLSGGQRQRVSIARAVVNSPSIILADEPTGNLDKKSGQAVMKILLELNKKGYTVIMVTHNTKQAEKAGRIIELSDGKVVRDVVNREKI